MNFSSILDRNVDRWPDKELIAFGGRSLTNALFAGRVHATAVAMREAGVRPGDVVALLLQNCPQFLEAAFAANCLGAAFLPLNYRLAADEWRYIVDHAGARLLVSEPDFHSSVDTVRAELPALEGLWSVGDDAPAGWTPHERLVQAHLGETAGVAPAEAHDVQRLMYTSGTTSRPKGVPITHGNLLWKNVAHILEFGITAADRTLVAGPLYHVGGLDLPATGVLYAGGSLVILPRFDPVAVLETIAAERITNVWLAPAMVNQILALGDAESYDTRTVRFVINGGEKMPVPLIERLLGIFPQAWFADAYGLTETVSGDTFLDREHTIAKIGSVGKPVLHLALRVCDDAGRDVGPGEVGEIALRGPKVFHGYWRDPDATARAIRDGWFYTGDVGRLDEDGYLYIDDRKKDLIVSGGENVASPEVERVLYEHRAVLEAAVIGMPDARWGEVPMAFVALKPETAATPEDISAFCATKLAKFKVPKRIEFVDALPRNPSGKVLKRVLRERLADQDK
ncbi:MAG TPA: long-chain fatty acid--CoA ligase [Gaiellaceae bacterium]|nr:long-chain fatty acid--CoA ligase [Gaiellaceae bacterium]